MKAKMSGIFRAAITVPVLVLVLLAIVSAQAPEQDPNRIISNSERWQDVYSVLQYGVLTSTNAQFLVSNRHATLITNSIPQSEYVWAVSSEDVPYVVAYDNILRSRGFGAEEVVFENVNLGLATLLEEVTSFIILDDAYGYNAISVAPYAAATNSFVLFTDRDNVDEIDAFLANKQPDSVMIFAQVDREVLDTLAKYNPEVVNEDSDRFLNNIEIVKRYQEVAPAKQAILTNGEFIEQEIMTGSEPVIFIGTNNVPQVVRDYISQSDIDVGVLIGNELVGTATFIRRQLGISVFVKFAQGARAPQGAISQVEALDMFYLPVYSLNLEIESIKYNQATSQLEVAIRNTEDQAAYFLGTYSLEAADGSSQTVGDTEAVFIDGDEVKTLVYEVDTIPEGRISADAFVVYGESPASLEKEIRLTLVVEPVRVLDNCQIQLNSLTVNIGRQTFYVETENIGDVACFVDVELVDVVIAGQKNSYSYEGVAEIDPGKTRDIRIIIDNFEEEDLEDNEQIRVRAFYGEREVGLIKIIEGIFDLEERGTDIVFYSLLLIILLLLLLILYRRKKKKDEKK